MIDVKHTGKRWRDLCASVLNSSFGDLLPDVLHYSYKKYIKMTEGQKLTPAQKRARDQYLVDLKLDRSARKFFDSGMYKLYASYLDLNFESVEENYRLIRANKKENIMEVQR